MHIRDPEVMAKLASSFDRNRILLNCPECKEVLEPFHNHYFHPPQHPSPFGNKFVECKTEESLCSNCAAIIDAWARGKGNGKYEIACLIWKWDPEKNAAKTTDKLFSRFFGPSNQSIAYFTEILKGKRTAIERGKWDRARNGPRYQADDTHFYISIPHTCLSADELTALAKTVRDRIRKRQSAKFLHETDVGDTKEIHFDGGSWDAGNLWEEGILPEPATIWRLNAGKFHQEVLYDSATKQALAYPAKALIPPQAHTNITSSATVGEAIAWLRQRLVEIDVINPELTDTATRDILHEIMDDGFVTPQPDFILPHAIGLDTREGEKSLRKTLADFLKIAAPAAAAANLSSKHRAELLNKEQGIDEYLGEFTG